MNYTLKELQKRVNSLIEQQGEDADCAAWIYTKEDCHLKDEDGEFDYDNPVIYGDGAVYYKAAEEGGSYAWIDGSRISALADHPDPANPGTGDPFRIKVPFEVWDMEAEGGPAQIDITIYDRIQSFDGLSGDTLYAFNPYNRMYTHFIHLPYAGPEGFVWC